MTLLLPNSPPHVPCELRMLKSHIPMDDVYEDEETDVEG